MKIKQFRLIVHIYIFHIPHLKIINFFIFFKNFEAPNELKKNFKYRFIPNNNSVVFHTEVGLNGKLSSEHSIILDCAEIELL